MADYLAGPVMWALLVAVPMSGILSALGRNGVVAAVLALLILIAGNVVIAYHMSEYGEFAAVVALAAAFFGGLPILIGWHFGEFVRERCASPGKRH